MSVENLRVDEPNSKGWANLFMNNLTVYNEITAKKVTTEEPHRIIQELTYQFNNGSVVTDVPVEFVNTNGMVNMHFPTVSDFTLVNASSTISLTAPLPFPSSITPRKGDTWTVGVVFSAGRGVGTLELGVNGNITLYAPNNDDGSNQLFPVGITELQGLPSFTYMAN